MASNHEQQGENDELLSPVNYFNYFTEIEEHFRKARGTSLFLLSPLDWALIESWKSSGVPLEAVLRGIDESFEKWRSRKTKTRQVNSLAYCAQAVLETAQRMSGASGTRTAHGTRPPFEIDDIRAHLARVAALVRNRQHSAYEAIAAALDGLANEAEQHAKDAEDLERRLTALEEKMIAIARSQMADDQLLDLRRILDAELAPYRTKMTAEQISMLERRYLDTRLLEIESLPRLSLFYMQL